MWSIMACCVVCFVGIFMPQFVKPRKISNFQEKWQNNNCHNGSGKPRKFSRSWMTKRTTSLESSCEI